MSSFDTTDIKFSKRTFYTKFVNWLNCHFPLNNISPFRNIWRDILGFGGGGGGWRRSPVGSPDVLPVRIVYSFASVAVRMQTAPRPRKAPQDPGFMDANPDNHFLMRPKPKFFFFFTATHDLCVGGKFCRSRKRKYGSVSISSRTRLGKRKRWRTENQAREKSGSELTLFKLEAC